MSMFWFFWLLRFSVATECGFFFIWNYIKCISANSETQQNVSSIWTHPQKETRHQISEWNSKSGQEPRKKDHYIRSSFLMNQWPSPQRKCLWMRCNRLFALTGSHPDRARFFKVFEMLKQIRFKRLDRQCQRFYCSSQAIGDDITQWNKVQIINWRPQSFGVAHCHWMNLLVFHLGKGWIWYWDVWMIWDWTSFIASTGLMIWRPGGSERSTVMLKGNEKRKE